MQRSQELIYVKNNTERLPGAPSLISTGRAAYRACCRLVFSRTAGDQRRSMGAVPGVSAAMSALSVCLEVSCRVHPGATQPAPKREPGRAALEVDAGRPGPGIPVPSLVHVSFVWPLYRLPCNALGMK